jgi:hypothetical protein
MTIPDDNPDENPDDNPDENSEDNPVDNIQNDHTQMTTPTYWCCLWIVVWGCHLRVAIRGFI